MEGEKTESEVKIRLSHISIVGSGLVEKVIFYIIGLIIIIIFDLISYLT
jgi:hypothetical protein